MNNQDVKWTKVYSCDDGIEAQLIKNLMEIENIPVRLLNINSNNIFPDSSIAEIDIYVPEEYVEQAEILIEENFE